MTIRRDYTNGSGYICPAENEAIRNLDRPKEKPVTPRPYKNVLREQEIKRMDKPTPMLLLARDATVTVCHSHTPRMELNAAISRAGIIVCASGYKGLLDHWMQSRYMDSLQTVVNVGGDYDEESVWHKTSKINLVPYRGGVGPVTAAVLMSHVLM